MKRRTAFVCASIMLLAAGALLVTRLAGSRPFRSLTAGEIGAASVLLSPPGVELELTEAETAELVSLLNRAVTYQEDGSYTEYAGQTVLFTLQKTDGTYAQVSAFQPFLIIDGVGYRAKYAPCEALNRFANDLIRER